MHSNLSKSWEMLEFLRAHRLIVTVYIKVISYKYVTYVNNIIYIKYIYICISVTFAGGLGQHCIGFSTRLQLRRYLQADHIWTELTHCDNLPPLEVQDVIEANCSRVCPRNALLDFEPDCYASLFVKRFRDFIYFVEHIMNI